MAVDPASADQIAGGGLAVSVRAAVLIVQAARLAAALAAAGFLAAVPAVVGKTRICVYNSNHA